MHPLTEVKSEQPGEEGNSARERAAKMENARLGAPIKPGSLAPRYRVTKVALRRVTSSYNTKFDNKFASYNVRIPELHFHRCIRERRYSARSHFYDFRNGDVTVAVASRNRDYRCIYAMEFSERERFNEIKNFR